MTVIPITITKDLLDHRGAPQVPPCAGDPNEYELADRVGVELEGCRLRTQVMVVGSDVIAGQFGMMVVGACGLHREAIERWLSQPYGAFTMEATPAALEGLAKTSQKSADPLWVMRREVA